MKLKGCILFITIIVFYTNSSAQYGNDFINYLSNNRSINVGAEYEINSDFLDNQFINRFYTGGYIDKGMKDRQLSRASGYNVVGGLINTNFTAFFGKDSSKYRFIAGLNHRQFFNAYLSDDAYKLAFYGNKQFQGKDANLGKAEINSFAFQELKMGFIIDGVDTTRATMGMALCYLNGKNFMRIRTNETVLFTAEDASYLNLKTDAQVSFSDTAAKKWTDFTGNGMSAEFFAQTPYRSKLGKSKFFLSVSNLGFIRWANTTYNYKADSTFTFSGVNVNDVFDLQDSTLNAISLDTILGNSTSLTRTRTSTNLPVTFLIIHKIQFTQWFEFTTGFRHLFNANYKPYLFLEGDFKLCKSFSTLAHIGFGGYGKLSGGIGVKYVIKDRIAIRLGSNSVQGFVSPKNTLGQGAYFSLSYKF